MPTITKEKRLAVVISTKDKTEYGTVVAKRVGNRYVYLTFDTERATERRFEKADVIEVEISTPTEEEKRAEQEKNRQWFIERVPATLQDIIETFEGVRESLVNNLVASEDHPHAGSPGAVATALRWDVTTVTQAAHLATWAQHVLNLTKRAEEPLSVEQALLLTMQRILRDTIRSRADIHQLQVSGHGVDKASDLWAGLRFFEMFEDALPLDVRHFIFGY